MGQEAAHPTIPVNPPADINPEKINEQIELGYIVKRPHPEAALWILNYTEKTQFDGHWTNETMICRGLVVDAGWNIVARPFPKFFSPNQLGGVLPDEPFEVFEKMDGSLGITYWLNGEPRICTRGSFESPQAVRGTQILREKYNDADLDPSLTYLFEIIYPENRIVVDYGDQVDLVMLGVIDTASGQELPMQDLGFPMAKPYSNFKDIETLFENQEANREGFVVRYESGQRIKIKFDDYLRLHKLLTGVSAKSVWEMLRSGQSLDDLINMVPDEFHQWVRELENGLRQQYAEAEATARSEMRFAGTRKELASHFKACRYPHLMFAMLDRRDYSESLWKMLKPSADDVFRGSLA